MSIKTPSEVEKILREVEEEMRKDPEQIAIRLINLAYKKNQDGAHDLEVAKAFEDAAQAMQNANMDGWGFMLESAKNIRAGR